VAFRNSTEDFFKKNAGTLQNFLRSGDAMWWTSTTKKKTSLIFGEILQLDVL